MLKGSTLVILSPLPLAPGWSSVTLVSVSAILRQPPASPSPFMAPHWLVCLIAFACELLFSLGTLSGGEL